MSPIRRNQSLREREAKKQHGREYRRFEKREVRRYNQRVANEIKQSGDCCQVSERRYIHDLFGKALEVNTWIETN